MEEVSKLTDEQVVQIVSKVAEAENFKTPLQTVINKSGEVEESRNLSDNEVNRKLTALLYKDPAVFLGIDSYDVFLTCCKKDMEAF